MKLTEIETENKLILKFKYKGKPFSMVVALIAKNSQYIIIPSILENDQVVDPASLTEVEIIYTIKEGVFCFTNNKLDATTFNGIRVYYVSSEEDIQKENRREAYRVFIGDLVKILAVTPKGKKKNVEGILKNLSVTGMGVMSKQEFELGTTLRIIYNFEGVNFLLLGQIIRKDKLYRYRAYSYGCKFNDANNSVNRIIMLKQLRQKNSKKNNTQNE